MCCIYNIKKQWRRNNVFPETLQVPSPLVEPVILLLLNDRRKVINTERINLWLRQTEHIRVYLWHGYPTTVNLVMVTIVKQSQWWPHLSHLPIKYVKKRYICFCYIRLLPCVLKFNKINWLYYFSCLNIYMQCTTSANSFRMVCIEGIPSYG